MSAWSRIRGTTVFQARVDLHNGFPGVVRTGPSLERVELAITSEFLIVAEGHPSGFAIALDDLVNIAATPSNMASNPALEVRYRDGELIRRFAIGFRGVLRPLRGGHRAGQAARCLTRFGVPDSGTSASIGLLTYSWEEAAQFSTESQIWNGTLSGPVGGRMTSALGPCRIWLTLESLIWAPLDGDGIRRVPWSEVTCVRCGDSGHPLRRYSVVIGTGSAHEVDGHYSFRFDQSDDPIAELHSRKAFENALAAIGRAPVRADRPRPPWLGADEKVGSIATERSGLAVNSAITASKPPVAGAFAALRVFEKDVKTEIAALGTHLESGDTAGLAGVPSGGDLANAVRALATCVAAGSISVEASELRLRGIKDLDAQRLQLRTSGVATAAGADPTGQTPGDAAISKPENDAQP